MVSKDVETAKQYDERYGIEGLYWSSRPSAACYEILRLMPPDRPVRVLDIGCGEGRNALFLGRKGYHVDAFDISRKGVDKAARLADEIGVPIKVYRANLVETKLTEEYDVPLFDGCPSLYSGYSGRAAFGNIRELQAVYPAGLASTSSPSSCGSHSSLRPPMETRIPAPGDRVNCSPTTTIGK